MRHHQSPVTRRCAYRNHCILHNCRKNKKGSQLDLFVLYRSLSLSPSRKSRAGEGTKRQRAHQSTNSFSSIKNREFLWGSFSSICETIPWILRFTLLRSGDLLPLRVSTLQERGSTNHEFASYII